MKLVERVRLAVGDLDRRRCLVVPQSPLIGKREVILQEMPKAALIAAADVVFGYVMATQFHSQGDAVHRLRRRADHNIMQQHTVATCLCLPD